MNNSIKHIVLSGGGVICFNQLGILKESFKNNLWNYNDITSIWGTSAGSFLAFILCLKYDLETIEEYFVKRPWQNVFKINIESILYSYENKGMLDKSVIIDVFSPLFKASDINIDITMKELFEITKIDLHLFTTKFDTLELIDISHMSYPNWKVIDAIYCSSCLPLLFSPFNDETTGNLYLDGGIIQNYPLKQCIEKYNEPDNTMGIQGKFTDRVCEINNYQEFNLFNYIMKLIDTMVIKLNGDHKSDYSIKHEFLIKMPIFDIYSIYLVTNNKGMREKLIKEGYDCVIHYINLYNDA
jgi:predicted acylesterase/phospholipase RssA